MGTDSRNVGDGLPVQVKRGHYLTLSYCKPDRFVSFSYQIREALLSKTGHMLEVGPGNGVVTYMLRVHGVKVETCDIDESVNPDRVCSVADLPYGDSTFDTAMCCQVLEHIPWKTVDKAVSELARVSTNSIIISVPSAYKHYYVKIKLPGLKLTLLNLFLKRRRVRKHHPQHHWELGRGVNAEDLVAIFKKHGLKLVRSYRLPEHRYHHFFILRK